MINTNIITIMFNRVFDNRLPYVLSGLELRLFVLCASFAFKNTFNYVKN